MQNKTIFYLTALALAATGLYAAPTPLAIPADTKAKASFATDGDRGKVENLIDGDPATSMSGAASSCKGANEPVWIDLTFPQPVADLAGLETGKSDAFKNYYPKQAQFWVDTDGNGTFDTLGTSVKLGPADESVGQHLFAGRIPKAYGVRFLVTEQNAAGLNRCFVMTELGLVVAPAAEPMTLTPDRKAEDAVKELQIAAAAAEKLAAEERRRNAPKPDQSIVPGSEKLPGAILPLPLNTKISCSVGTDKDGGPAVLFDGDPSTVLRTAGGSCKSSSDSASIYLRFPEPVADIGGVETGNSDPFHNYYPVEMEFWADSNGDGRFDTLLGRTRKLGPAAQSVGRHRFAGKLQLIYGLEIRAVEQHVGGGKRAFQMDEMRLVRDADLPIVEATPLSYRSLFYKGAMPAGTTIKASFATEEGKGPEALLDNDPTTFMNARQGTAKAGVPASLFLRFPKPVSDLMGIQIGGSDPFNNYVWKEMEVWVDTTGDGTYDTQAAKFAAGSGERRFPQTVPKAYGMELRVTQQSLQGTFRCFMLNGLNGLVFKDGLGDSEMRYVVEDFEDLSSWRTWANNTAQPEGERYYGGYTYVVGDYRPELAHNGVGVGRVRCYFKDGRSSLWATRGRVTEQEGIIDGIRFWGNPQGYECSVNFELIDAKGRKFGTPGVKLTGNEWKEYVIDTTATAIPAVSGMTYPFVIKHIFVNTEKGGIGDVLLDDITVVGIVDRSKRVRIRPVYEGMGYDPTKPLVAKYRLWNALGKEVVAPLQATLYSSFDPKHASAVVTKTQTVTLAPYAETVVAVDFGSVAYGHYEAYLSLESDGISAELTDPVAVVKLNGGRINKTPMWFGSQHPDGWISAVENSFVYREVVKPLGIDCYRGGAPKKELIDLGLLVTAGLPGVPPELRKPTEKNDDRGEPTDYVAYEQWCKEQAAATLAPYADSILCLEYYNEPDLPNFCYKPEINVYLKMWRAFAAGVRAGAPGVKIGTGGNTVQHGKEKKDFNSRMYTELAKEADVAIWHAHGPLENYAGRQRMVESWLETGGKPKDQMLQGNTEAGIPGGESAIGSLNQADNLVKKIGWAKSQKNSYFYQWFTTTDTYDPQGGYLNNENWGLITYNQRLKPSGQAYNELIRKLANTEGLGEVDLDGRLQACAYLRDDGTQVWLVWPRERGTVLALRFAASGPVTITDIFGSARTVTPEKGILRFDGNGWPFYVEAQKGIAFGSADIPEFVAYPAVLGVPPGASVSIPVTLRNVWGRAVTLKTSARGSDGTVFATAQTELPAGAVATVNLNWTLSPDATFGSQGCALLVSSVDPAVDEVLPLTLVVAEMAVKAGPFVIDGVPDKLANGRPLVLDQEPFVRELVSDPDTPVWKDASDLSATVNMAHDDKGLYFCIDVRDQSHNPGEASDKLWVKDSVQVAFYAGDAHLEIGLTETEGGFGWCWIASDMARTNHKLETPLAVKRTGDHTIYEVYLPFDVLGIKAYAPMLPLRLTFMVNEDDGRGRVRILHWFDGIAAGKSPDLFGHLVLE